MKRLDKIIAITGAVILTACGGDTEPVGETPTRQTLQESTVSAASLDDVYVNDRYAFQISYPGTVLERRDPPQNDDGQAFDGPESSELRVFGAHDVLSTSLAEKVEEERATFERLTEDRQSGNTWLGFGYGEDEWRAVKIIDAGDTYLTAEYSAPADATPELRNLARRIVKSMESTAQS